MKNDRRTFLKTAALAGAAATSGLGGLTTPAAARTGAARAGTQQLPKGMTFATLRQGGEYGLGIRTERGVLDVVKAESELSEGAPTTINAVLEGEGDMAALARLIDKARAAGERFFVPENAAEFGPCVTDPEKIICIGLNYRKHAAETGNPVPTLPILFNKFNSALNHHGGTIAVSKEPAEKFDYEAELVIVIGREARNVSEEEAPNYIFG
ncbi:MAG: fumarylacetoacetate hydrolase family protein, partial [Microvirga sp.]